jgi:copper chaperone
VGIGTGGGLAGGTVVAVPPRGGDVTIATYRVTGMTCEHCVRAVTEEIGKLSGVTAVDVDLPSETVTVASDTPLDDTALRAAVDEAGYELVP